jgi:hypothetical protein
MHFHPDVALLVLVFLIGVGAGALLNSLYRASKVEKIKAEFHRQLLEEIANRERGSALDAGAGNDIRRNEDEDDTPKDGSELAS